MRAAGPPLLLFAEDFDEPVRVPPPPRDPEPTVVEPLYSLAELEAAREAAAQAAVAAVRVELAEAHEVQVRMVLADISAALADARQASERLAAAQAEALARLVIDVVRTALPNLCTRHGAAEARAMFDLLRPGLLAEPQVVIQLNPGLAALLAQDLAALDAALPGDVRISPMAALLPGDVRVNWQNGAAERDTQALLAGIDAALGAAGLWRESKEGPDGD